MSEAERVPRWSDAEFVRRAMEVDAMAITHIKDLTPDAKNARRHTPRNVGMLERSLNEVGAARSIVIDEDGTVLAGNATIEAAAQAGITRVQVVDADGDTIVAVRRSGLTGEQKTKLALYDNRVAELAEWEPGVLAEIAGAFDLSHLFTTDELAELTQPSPPEAGAGGDEFDPTPEDGPTRTALGELWSIGGVHRLLVGDCTDAANVARLMGGERAGAVVSDPPYGIKWNTDPSGSRGGKGYAPIVGDDKPFDPSALMGDWDTVLWGANHYADKLPAMSFWVVWDKRPSGYQNDQSDCELAWTNIGGPARIFRKAWSGGGTLAKENGVEERSIHPTQKPIDLLIYCIELCKGEVVYDPFLGSGTTLIAAHRTGRRCFGCEIAPRYADVILRRAEAEGLDCERIDG